MFDRNELERKGECSVREVVLLLCLPLLACSCGWFVMVRLRSMVEVDVLVGG